MEGWDGGMFVDASGAAESGGTEPTKPTPEPREGERMYQACGRFQESPDPPLCANCGFSKYEHIEFLAEHPNVKFEPGEPAARSLAGAQEWMRAAGEKLHSAMVVMRCCADLGEAPTKDECKLMGEAMRAWEAALTPAQAPPANLARVIVQKVIDYTFTTELDGRPLIDRLTEIVAAELPQPQPSALDLLKDAAELEKRIIRIEATQAELRAKLAAPPAEELARRMMKADGEDCTSAHYLRFARLALAALSEGDSIGEPGSSPACEHCREPIHFGEGIWWHTAQKRDIHTCLTGGTVATPTKGTT